jgi:effector-binding domain-containing protein
MVASAKAGGWRALAAAMVLLAIPGFCVCARAQSTPAPVASPAPAPSPEPAPSPTPAASATPSPSPSPSDSAGTGEIVELTARPVAATEGKASRDEVYNAIMGSLAAIQAELDKAGLKSAGNPLAVFLEADDSGFKYRAEIPITATPADKTQLSDSVKFGLSPAGKAMRFEHRGEYDEIDYTYEAITAYLDEKGVDAEDVFIEEYLNLPKSSDDPNLQVDIFVLIK